MVEISEEANKSNTNGQDAVIKVIGIGGGGNNAVDRMIEDDVCDVEYFTANTDYQVLSNTKTINQIQLGKKLTRGLGAGGKAEIGQEAAEESSQEIEEIVEDANIIIVTAGMGGGTGTGAAPVIANIAKEKGNHGQGALTIGVVTKPFSFEGRKKMKSAIKGIIELKKNVDTLVVIPNDKLIELSDENMNIRDSFKLADDALRSCVSGITTIINETGDINVDLQDVVSTMNNKGVGHIGKGHATGKNKVELALEMAINNPLLETSINGACRILVDINADDSVGVNEVSVAMNTLYEKADEDVDIIWGVKTLDNITDEVSIILIATDLDDNRFMYEEEVEMPVQQQPRQVPVQNTQQNMQQTNTIPVQNVQQPIQQTGQIPVQNMQQTNTIPVQNIQQTGQIPVQNMQQTNPIPVQEGQPTGQIPVQADGNMENTAPNIQPVEYADEGENENLRRREKKSEFFKGHFRDLL